MTTTMNGGADGPLATVEEMAAVGFRAEPRFANVPLVALRAMADNIYRRAVIAAVVCSFEKDALVEFVAEHPDTVGPWLMELADAALDAHALADTIGSAEARLAVALAVVEGDDDGPDDGGGETIAA